MGIEPRRGGEWCLTMGTVILLRHGRSTANTQQVLAGRAGGVSLDDLGRTQADAAGERLAEVRLAAILSSPLERCRATAKAVAARHPQLPVRADRGPARGRLRRVDR